MSEDRESLRADCSSCFALCCTALAFGKSADFAFSKPGGRPCRNLLADDRCGIHQDLLTNGMGGCVRYDCFGAGQHVSQTLFGGQSWRERPDTDMFDVFWQAQWLFELLWYLADALERDLPEPVRSELAGQQRAVRDLVNRPAEQWNSLDPWDQIKPLLAIASAMTRGVPSGGGPPPQPDHSGARLARADLSRRDLRGARFLGTDLSGADLRRADLLGADLRHADLSGADLRGALFLTQAQVNGARGDQETRLPAAVRRPGHWG